MFEIVVRGGGAIIGTVGKCPESPISSGDRPSGRAGYGAIRGLCLGRHVASGTSTERSVGKVGAAVVQWKYIIMYGAAKSRRVETWRRRTD